MSDDDMMSTLVLC